MVYGLIYVGTFRHRPSTVKIKVFCSTVGTVFILRSQLLVLKVFFLAVINASAVITLIEQTRVKKFI